MSSHLKTERRPALDAKKILLPSDEKCVVASAPMRFFTNSLAQRVMGDTPFPQVLAKIVAEYTLTTVPWHELSPAEKEHRKEARDFSWCDFSKVPQEELLSMFMTYCHCATVNFIGANLSNVSLVGVRLVKADFRDADLISASLSRINLSEADFRGANLTQAHLIKVNLTKADFQGAVLLQTKLEQVNLAEAILEGAKIRDIILIRTELPKAITEISSKEVDQDHGSKCSIS